MIDKAIAKLAQEMMEANDPVIQMIEEHLTEVCITDEIAEKILADGTFIQCRGEYNCSMTEEVKDFTEKVVKEFKRMIKKKAREAA